MGVPYAIDVNAGWRMPFTGLLCKEPPYGGITAIDMRLPDRLAVRLSDDAFKAREEQFKDKKPKKKAGDA